MRAFCQHPDVVGFYQVLKESLRRDGRADLGLLGARSPLRRDPRYRGRLLLFKETLGPNNEEECTFEMFPDDRSLAVARPVFMFRDPRATYDSWKRNQLGDLDLFCLAYRTVYERFLRAREVVGHEGCYGLVYEQLTASPSEVLSTVCALWGIEMQPELLRFRQGLAESIENVVDPELADDREAYDLLHAVTEESTTFHHRPPRFEDLSDAELAYIERTLLASYHEVIKLSRAPSPASDRG